MMFVRVKTEAQRAAILEAATDVFRNEGYERASMNQVAKRLGGSKGTLYGYFSSKQELFAAVMLHSIEEAAFEAFRILEVDAERPLAELLTDFGAAYLRFVLGEEALEITRLAIAEGKSGDWGARLYAETVQAGWRSVANLFSQRLPQSRLPEGGIEEVALQYRAVLVADLMERHLRGVDPDPTCPSIEQASERAAALITRAYGASAPG